MKELEAVMIQSLNVQSAMAETLEKIQFFTHAAAIAAGLTLGLVVWRLFILSKNQRRLF